MPRTKSREAHLFRVARRRGWIVVTCAIVAGIVAYVVASSEKKSYTATASLLFQRSQLDQQLFGYSISSEVTDPDRVAATNVELASEPAVGVLTARQLSLTPRVVKDDIAVDPAGTSDVVNVAATAGSPVLAARMANEYANEVIAYRRAAQRALVEEAANGIQQQITRLQASGVTGVQLQALQTRLSQLQVLVDLQTGDVQLANTAAVPNVPSAPHIKRDTGIGVLLGAFVGIFTILMLERLDRRMRDPADAAETYDMTVLAAVPQSRALEARGRSVARSDPKESEIFRLLRAQLRYFNVDREIRTILVTSAAPAEGKSTVAWNLARTAAAAGGEESVVLLEADLRRPTVARLANLNPAPGLSESLSGSGSWEEVMQTVALPDGALDVMVAGGLAPNPTELFESKRFKTLLAELANRYRLVVIDAPPALVVSDPLPLIQAVDGVVVVARVGRTRRDQAAALREQLEKLHAPVLGLVINGVQVGVGSSYYDYGYYADSSRTSQDDDANRDKEAGVNAAAD